MTSRGNFGIITYRLIQEKKGLSSKIIHELSLMEKSVILRFA